MKKNINSIFLFVLFVVIPLSCSLLNDSEPNNDQGSSGGGKVDTIYFSVSGTRFSNGTPTNIDYTSATIIGDFSSIAFQITEHGHVWSEAPNSRPELNQVGVDKTALGAINRKGNFQSKLTGLKPGTVYYVRSYIAKSDGTIEYHSSSAVFRTINGSAPILGISTPKDTTQTSFSISAEISKWGGSTITQHGFVWSSSTQQPLLTNNEGIISFGQGLQGTNFAHNVSNLKPNTIYYIKAYATNSFGTNYSELRSIKTKPLYVVENGLIAYYTFEQNFEDQATKKYDGFSTSVEFSPQSPSGIGFSAQFIPSASPRVTIPLNPIYQLEQASFCFWIKSNKVGNQCIIHANSLSSTNAFNIILLNIQNNYTYDKIVFNSYQEILFSPFWPSIFDQVNPSKTILDGNWHFVGITIKPSEQRLYVDGKLMEQKTDQTGMVGAGFNNGLIIGQYRDGDPMFFNGNMDNLRIYGRILSPKEIEDIFKAKQ